VSIDARALESGFRPGHRLVDAAGAASTNTVLGDSGARRPFRGNRRRDNPGAAESGGVPSHRVFVSKGPCAKC